MAWPYFQENRLNQWDPFRAGIPVNS
jgi:hypothetical protein